MFARGPRPSCGIPDGQQSRPFVERFTAMIRRSCAALAVCSTSSSGDFTPTRPKTSLSWSADTRPAIRRPGEPRCSSSSTGEALVISLLPASPRPKGRQTIARIYSSSWLRRGRRSWHNLLPRATFLRLKRFWKPPFPATWSRRPGTMQCTGCSAAASMKRSPNIGLDPRSRAAKRLPRS